MHLLYCDETNFEKKPGDFFVYGGVIVEATSSRAFANEIEHARRTMGIPRDYVLKFNPGPAGLSHQDFIALKQAVIDIASRHGARLLVNLLLHDIATSSEEARRFGVNTLCYHFDCFLNRVKGPGIVLIDRFDDKKIDGQLKEKVAIGLTGQLPYGQEMKIENIVGFHYTAIGQSHFCSVVDVLLGSLRFAINAYTQNATVHQASATAILQQLAPLFHRESGQDRVSQLGLWFSPKEVKAAHFRAKYQAMRDHLAAHGVTASQPL